ncbi:MAG: hypothetical protein IPO00_03190 [Betaproteobacteria bacterium]|nr:hypothetical protein [Betaproteobacteria bacterium]
MVNRCFSCFRILHSKRQLGRGFRLKLSESALMSAVLNIAGLWHSVQTNQRFLLGLANSPMRLPDAVAPVAQLVTVAFSGTAIA